jgi:hypothetical protein
MANPEMTRNPETTENLGMIRNLMVADMGNPQTRNPASQTPDLGTGKSPILEMQFRVQ